MQKQESASRERLARRTKSQKDEMAIETEEKG
jgi:hypothetical protein